METGLIIALVGVGGTLLAGTSSQLLAGFHSRRSWLREQRLELYLDALRRGTHLRQTRLDYHNEVSAMGGDVQIVPQDEVTIRIDLLAHHAVRRA